MKLTIIWLLILQTLIPSSWAQDPALKVASGWSLKELKVCQKAYRKTPPLWVLPSGFDTRSENSRGPNRNYIKGESTGSDNPFFVPKRAIVQLFPSSQSKLENLNSETLGQADFLRVRVLSVPPKNDKLLESPSGGIKEIIQPRNKDNPLAAPGDQGFIRYRDLEKLENQSQFIFMVKQDSVLFQFLENRDLGTNAYALKFHQENDKYVVNNCCGDVEHPEKKGTTVKVCRDFAIFKILDANTGEVLNGVSPLEVNCESCYLNGLVALKKDFLSPLQNLLNSVSQDSAFKNLNSISRINFVDTRGFVQIPVTPVATDPTIRKGPFGSQHYTAEKGEADLYMRPESACAFVRVLEKWQKQECPRGDANCQVRFGNASHAHYNSSMAKGAPYWPHFSHDSGECIDIVPMYKEGCDGGCSFHSASSQNQKMKSLLDLMIAAGADSCFVSHRSLIQGSRGTCTYDSNHDDHLHICFPVKKNSRPNAKLLETCQKGLK
ncbi:MAG: hypothetical protein ACK5V3_15120 [Bdellovibrionales bacterium]